MPLGAILGLREAYRREMACQIVHDSWHARGFAASYRLSLGGRVVGYGSVGGVPGEPRETIKEFFLVPEARGSALAIFRRLIEVAGARAVEAQTNDPLLLLMLLDCATGWAGEKVLFADGLATAHRVEGATFRALGEGEEAGVFAHTREPVGEYALEVDGRVVATGGLVTRYNPPYADIFMEVDPGWRRRGIGSYLVQELKRACREAGMVPAARCDPDNVASRRTLERAGMFPCARILRGILAT